MKRHDVKDTRNRKRRRKTKRGVTCLAADIKAESGPCLREVLRPGMGCSRTRCGLQLSSLCLYFARGEHGSSRGCQHLGAALVDSSLVIVVNTAR